MFNDDVPTDTVVAAHQDTGAVLDTEDRTGRVDPSRVFGARLHVVARTVGPDSLPIGTAAKSVLGR